MTPKQLKLYKPYYDPYSVGMFYKFATRPVFWLVYDFDEECCSDLCDYVLASLFDNNISKNDMKIFRKCMTS